MRTTGRSLIAFFLLSVVAGVSIALGAQQPQNPSISVDLKFDINQQSSEAIIKLVVTGESIVSSLKDSLGEEGIKNLLSKEIGAPERLIEVNFGESNLSILIKMIGQSPPHDGIDFVIHGDVGEVIAALLGKLGLSGIPVNLSVSINLPKGAEVKELKVSPEDSFETKVEDSFIIIISKSPSTLGKGSLSLHLKYSIQGSKRTSGE